MIVNDDFTLFRRHPLTDPERGPVGRSNTTRAHDFLSPNSFWLSAFTKPLIF
jgi:hypothetical protein